MDYINPDYAGALTRMHITKTQPYQDYRTEQFLRLVKLSFIRKLYLIIAHFKFINCYLTSNHPSNCLSLKALLPQGTNNFKNDRIDN